MFNEGTNVGAVLKAAYTALVEGTQVIGPSYLLKKLGMPKSSAQKMLLKAAELGYGTYSPRKGLILNDRGIKKAEKIVRKHRLLECLLEEVGVKKESICVEAGKIDLVIGDEFMAALEKRYGCREYCPCGNRIPAGEDIASE